MPGGGSHIFAEPDQYEARLRQAQIEFLITPRGGFDASLTWAELSQVSVLYCEEAFPRIAYLRLPSHLVFVTFPQTGPMPVWDGMQMRAGEVMFHGSGHCLHQSTLGLSGWSVIAVNPERLADFYKALTGEPLVIPATASVLQPAR